MIELIIVAIVVFMVFMISYLHAFRKPCYRIKEIRHMRYDGSIECEFIVEQYRKFLMFEWWRIQSDSNEYSDGSSFLKLDEAETYIQSLIYNRIKHENIHEVIHNPTCLEDHK